MAKNRGLKNRVAFSNSIDKKLSKGFDQLKENTRIDKSKLLDEAIYDLLIKYKIDPDKIELDEK